MHTSDITRALYGRIRALYGKFDVIKMGVVGVHAVTIIIVIALAVPLGVFGNLVKFFDRR